MGVRCYINNKPRELISARIEKNGTRAIDTAKFVFSRAVPVTKADSITYLQDPTNIKHLVGVWNFSDNTRDESGYDLDGLETTADETDGTYLAQCDGRGLQLITATKAVKISNDSHLDFSAQFDIVLWVNKPNQYGQNNASYCFGKGDSNNSIEIQHTTVTGSSPDLTATIKATIIKGGTTYTLEASTPTNILLAHSKTTSGYNYIRLKRDENNLVTLMVNEIIEDTETISGDIATGNTYLYLGADKNGSNVWNGHLSQVKIYSGGYLTDDDYIVLRQTRRQPNTMKFGGAVWKIDEKPTHKIVYCKGFSKILHDNEIDTSDPSLNARWTNNTDIYKNHYTNKNGLEILTDLLYVLDTGIKVTDTEEIISGSSYDYNEYLARGTLYENIFILVTNGKTDASFSVGARKTLMIESGVTDHSSGAGNAASVIIFKEGVIKVNDLGYDDTNTVTQVTGITQIKELERTQTKVYNDFDSSTHREFTLQYKPLNIKITHSTDGDILQVASPTTNTEFETEIERKKIILGAIANTSGTYTIDYSYENILDNTSYFTGESNISTLGRISKTLYLPQIVNAGGNVALTQFISKYLTKFSGLNRRVSVKVPTLVNHIKENYKVRIIDSEHNAGTTSTPLDLSIKSIEYYYPEGITIINLGDHVLDSFDLDSSIGGSLHELRSNITKTQP